MTDVNQELINVINSFFKGNEALCLLCRETLMEAYGDSEAYSIRAGKSIRVGEDEKEPDFVIESGEYGYYINLRRIRQLLEFHPDNRSAIIEKAREFRKIYESTKHAATVFIDSEIDPSTGKILDLGAVKEDGTVFHENDTKNLALHQHVWVTEVP